MNWFHSSPVPGAELTRATDTLESDLFIENEIAGIGSGMNPDYVSATTSVDGLLNSLKWISLTADCERFTPRR